MTDFLKETQDRTIALGERLKAVRKNNGYKQVSYIGRAIERGESVLDDGTLITIQHLIQYAIEIGAGLGPYNTTP